MSTLRDAAQAALTLIQDPDAEPGDADRVEKLLTDALRVEQVPGAWGVRAKGTDWTGKPIPAIHAGIFTEDSGVPIALVHVETDAGKARAALIAAAPDLLEIVKRFRDGNDLHWDCLRLGQCHCGICSAIARAEGRVK